MRCSLSKGHRGTLLVTIEELGGAETDVGGESRGFTSSSQSPLWTIPAGLRLTQRRIYGVASLSGQGDFNS